MLIVIYVAEVQNEGDFDDLYRCDDGPVVERLPSLPSRVNWERQTDDDDNDDDDDGAAAADDDETITNLRRVKRTAPPNSFYWSVLSITSP